MEISLEARRVDKGSGEVVGGEEGLLLTCAFTMVARDPRTNKAMEVAPLVVESDEEKAVFRRGEGMCCGESGTGNWELISGGKYTRRRRRRWRKRI